MKINAATRLKASAVPYVSPAGTAREDHSGEELHAADDSIIAPSESYREKNEKSLDRQQQQRETEQHKESTSPGSDMSKTAVHVTKSASTPRAKDKWDTADVQYAGTQAPMRPEATHKSSLYQLAERMRLKASKGGITDSIGDDTNFLLEDAQSPKPDAQRSLNGSVVADRLGTEEDDLVKDQENYGTHAEVDSALVENLLLDPADSSTYARESNSNGSTTEHVEADSTADNDVMPGIGDGFTMQGEEGQTAKSVYDGDFDPAGRTSPDRMITEDPKDSGYLNIHSFAEDAYLDALADEEVTADADPSLWNMANQPMGQAG